MAVRRLNAIQDESELEHDVAAINSYLGLLRQNNEYANRRKILNMIDRRIFKEYVYIKGHYEILAIRNKHKKRTKTLKKIRDGDY